MAKLQHSGFLRDVPDVKSNEGTSRRTAGRTAPADMDAAPADGTETKEGDMSATAAAVMPSSTGETRAERRGRPRKNLIRTGKNRGLAMGYERFTLVANSDLLTWYRDYAYTYRVSMRDALEMALTQFRDAHADDDLQADPKYHD